MPAQPAMPVIESPIGSKSGATASLRNGQLNGDGNSPSKMNGGSRRTNSSRAARRAATLICDSEGVAELERRYLQAKLLGKLFGARQGRRRAAADILAATRLPEAAAALGRAAAREKDDALRSHYAAAKSRAEQTS